jgi:hypothetical protein
MKIEVTGVDHDTRPFAGGKRSGRDLRPEYRVGYLLASNFNCSAKSCATKADSEKANVLHHVPILACFTSVSMPSGLDKSSPYIRAEREVIL